MLEIAIIPKGYNNIGCPYTSLCIGVQMGLRLIRRLILLLLTAGYTCMHKSIQLNIRYIKFMFRYSLQLPQPNSLSNRYCMH